MTERIPGLLIRTVFTIGVLCLSACMVAQSPEKSVDPSNVDPVVNMRVGVAGVTALGKSASITLDRLELILTSSANDTVRDTITSSSTPSLNTSTASVQTIAKNFDLKPLRSWKIMAVTYDVLDSVIHRDSADIPVLYAGDTAFVALNLASRYALYEANFLTLPDSVSSSTPAQPKQALNINRLVLRIDGVTVRDSTATPGPYFAAGATHVLNFNYVASGTGTWRSVTSGTLKNLNAIQFPTQDTGYIMGDTVALRTTNGGDSWSDISSAAPRSMKTVSFANQSKGLAGGDSATVSHTTDGGATWSSQKISGFTNVYSAVSLLNDTGFAVVNATSPTGSSTYRRTLNGGATWTTTSGYANNIYAMSCFSTSACWVVGYGGTIRKNTTLSGTFPTILTSGTTKALRGVQFLDANLGWAVGDTGVILKTTNGGLGWVTKTSGTTQNLRAVHFLDTAIGFAVGENGTVLGTIDGGTTWAAQTSGTTRKLNGIWFAGATGYAVGDGGTILKLNDIRLIEMRVYGPMGSWDEANALFSGSRYVNVMSGLDATVSMILRWTGPTTGTGRLNATIGKTGKVTVDGGLSGTVIP